MRNSFNKKNNTRKKPLPFLSTPKRFLLLFFLGTLISASHSLYAQTPSLLWQRPLGGSGTDGSSKMILTSDGNYVMCGYTESFNYDVHGNHGSLDAWIVKLSSAGDTLWTKCYGGTSSDAFYSIQPTSDGGYIAAGTASSNNGDVHGNHGAGDAWIVKLNSSGDTLWTKCYGGTAADNLSSIALTSDGGYIATGSTSSNNGDVTGNHGATDAWIIKLDASGNIQWQKCYGGSIADATYFLSETFYVIKEAPGNTYIAAGYTCSVDGNVTGNHGGSDYWVVKINNTGDILWQKCYGSSKANNYYPVEIARDLVLTPDSGFLVVGDSEGIDGDISTPKGGAKADIWVIKLDGSGTLQWEKSYGGISYDNGYSVNITAAGGYLIGGCTASSNGDLLDNPVGAASDNSWIIKTDASGTILWDKHLGNASGVEYVMSLYELADGSIVAGANLQGAAGDGVGIRGSVDAWVYKLSSCPAPLLQTASICSGQTYNFYGTLLTTAGVYRDTLARTSACPNYVQLTLTVNPLPVPTITQSGNLVSTGTFTDYKWLLNKQPLAYAAGKKTFTAEGNNDYQLIVTDANGCKNDTTNAFTFLYNGCEAPAIDWSKSYGGTGTDQAFSVTAVTDGYLVSGRSNSVNGDVKGLHGTANDLWIIKISNTGDTLWTKTLGGNGADNGYAIRATSDGGFVVVGESVVNATTGTIGTTPRPVASSTTDVWIVKYSSSGTLEWQNLYGGTAAENAYSIEQTSDGYIISGSVPATSTTGTLAGTTSNGGNDGWILKLNTDGTLAWQKRFGGGGTEHLHSVKPTSDGGYIAVGYSIYNATAGTLGATPRPISAGGGEDAWVVKMDATGTVQWQQLLGGSGADRAYAVKQTTDGGYLLSGYAANTSTDGTLTGVVKPGGNDFWIIKLDNTGVLQWQKALGGTGSDQALSFDIIAEADGYVFTGLSASVDGNTTGNKGSNDYWVIKTDLNGILQWQKSLGGTAADQANSIIAANDGGYIVTGYASAGGIADNKGGNDFYITKLNACRTCTTPTTASICDGDDYDFNGTPVSTAGIFKDTTDVSGCKNIQALTLQIDPVYTTPLTNAVCSGESYDFHGTIVSSAGTFYHVLTTAKGCDSTLSLTLTLNNLPSPIITFEGDELSTTTFNSYEWLQGNISKGVLTQTYTPATSGQYRVLVGDVNGCHDTSDVFVYTATSIREGNKNGNMIALFPNPATNELTIAFGQTNSADFHISLSSMDGRELVSENRSGDVAVLNISSLAQGIYILKVYEKGELKTTEKIIKK